VDIKRIKLGAQSEKEGQQKSTGSITYSAFERVCHTVLPRSNPTTAGMETYGYSQNK
jgi:hypothetical protein